MIVCKGCLTVTAHHELCGKCRRELFGSQDRVSLTLPFSRKEFFEYRQSSAPVLSISGVQDKLSLRPEKGRLVPVREKGEFILKPAPDKAGLRYRDDLPANEHLSMTLARQFSIKTAAVSMTMFNDGEPAYIAKRFDISDGKKLLQEDFCQLSGRTEENCGKNYKYDGTYEEMGGLIKKFCPAYKVETVKFFRLLLYCYAIGNGDAHLKNFSLIESAQGDHILSPAYDLLNTAVHIQEESRTALEMFREYETEFHKKNAFYSGFDFIKLGGMFGIPRKVIDLQLREITAKTGRALDIIGRSFMSTEAKSIYREIFTDRLKALEQGNG